ncbi:hypothetical protein [Sulfobacillus harzensis]|uniref:Uncharacterized protein n=1 Tax=Sulfobacillus harzensis TaxID=2729629 RepID=A0A7Y0L8G3_9FIRM|nr:hypothetical protein [Sulfobacillus harzensis]NMP25135.1 hypothetical protein [Sulfobacillus harzensis]
MTVVDPWAPAEAVSVPDARANRQGHFVVIDVNMKPNSTGPGRPGRANQASLVGIAASALGWTYRELIANIASQSWMAY